PSERRPERTRELDHADEGPHARDRTDEAQRHDDPDLAAHCSKQAQRLPGVGWRVVRHVLLLSFSVTTSACAAKLGCPKLGVMILEPRSSMPFSRPFWPSPERNLMPTPIRRAILAASGLAIASSLLLTVCAGPGDAT